MASKVPYSQKLDARLASSNPNYLATRNALNASGLKASSNPSASQLGGVIRDSNGNPIASSELPSSSSKKPSGGGGANSSVMPSSSVSAPTKAEIAAGASLVNRNASLVPTALESQSRASLVNRNGGFINSAIKKTTNVEDIQQVQGNSLINRSFASSQANQRNPNPVIQVAGDVGEAYFGSVKGGGEFGRRTAGPVGEVGGMILGGGFGILSGFGALAGGTARRASKPFVGEPGSQLIGAGADVGTIFLGGSGAARVLPKAARYAERLPSFFERLIGNSPRLEKLASEASYGLNQSRRLGIGNAVKGVYATPASKVAAVARPAFDIGGALFGKGIAPVAKSRITGAAVTGFGGLFGVDIARKVGQKEEGSNARAFLNTSEAKQDYSLIVNQAEKNLVEKNGGLAGLGFELGGGLFGENRAAIGGGGFNEVKKVASDYYQGQGYSRSDAIKLGELQAREFRRSQQGYVGSLVSTSISSEAVGQLLAGPKIANVIERFTPAQAAKLVGKFRLPQGPLGAAVASVKPIGLAGAYEGGATVFSQSRSFRRQADPLAYALGIGGGAASAAFLGAPVVYYGVKKAITKSGGLRGAAVEQFGKILDPYEDVGDRINEAIYGGGVKIRTKVRTVTPSNVPGNSFTPSNAYQIGGNSKRSVPNLSDSLFGRPSSNVPNNSNVPNRGRSTDISQSLFGRPSSNVPNNSNTSENTNTDENVPSQMDTFTPVNVPTPVPLNRALGFPFFPSSGDIGAGGGPGRGRGVKYYNEFSAAFGGIFGKPVTRTGRLKASKTNFAKNPFPTGRNLLRNLGFINKRRGRR